MSSKVKYPVPLHADYDPPSGIANQSRDSSLAGDPSFKANRTRGVTKADDEWHSRVVLVHLSPAMQTCIMDMLEKHERVLGLIQATEHRIVILPGAKPICQLPNRAGSAKPEVIRKKIATQLHAATIEPCTSKWASSVLLTPRKDGTIGLFCQLSPTQRHLDRRYVPAAADA